MPGWDNDAWSRIEDYELFWKPFDARFRFRPGMSSETWPAIAEPAGSVTFDLAPVFSRGSGFAAEADAFNSQVLEAMTTVFAEGAALIALVWQHPSYCFWPFRQKAIIEQWRVPPFPNGDYSVFLTQDLEQGTFGHPWEQSICVFGEDLVHELEPRLSEWLQVKRRG